MLQKLLCLIGRHPVKFSLAAAALLLLITVGILYGNGFFRKAAEAGSDVPVTAASQVPDISKVRIAPLVSDSTGVNSRSGFKLLFESTPDVSDLRSALSVTPKQDYQLYKVSSNEYRLSFDKEMKPDSIYRFEIADNTGFKHSWAFQTKKTFRVLRTLPRNEAVQVPLNSGIEITFSHDNVKSLEKYFDIEPKTKGRFEVHKKTVVFVPEKLQASTVYTVTVKKGLGIEGSADVLENDCSFKFQTEVPGEGERNHFSFAEDALNFTLKAAPALQVFADESLVGTTAKLQIYKYASEDGYFKDLKRFSDKPSWALADPEKQQYDTTGMTEVSKIDAEIVKQEQDYWSTYYIVLPTQLPEGHYLLKAKAGGRTEYAMLQVSSISAYILVGSNKTVAWINDAVSGQPLKGALVSSGTNAPAKTGADGVAEINSVLPQENGGGYFFRVDFSGKPSFFAWVGVNNYLGYDYYYNGSESTDKYWTYLYLDKGLYLPTDTVNVWGVVKPRDPSDNTEKAVLELSRYNYGYGDGSEVVIDSKELGLSEIGTFTDKLQLSNYNSGYYDLNVKIGDKVIVSRSFSVVEYTKPPYKIDLAPGKRAVFASEKVDAGIRASFFEGSPVSGAKLDYSYSTGGYQPAGSAGRVTCDANGAAKVTLDTTSNSTSWEPRTLYFSVWNSDAEEAEVRSFLTMSVFPRDTMFEVKSSLKDGTAAVGIKTSRIDLSRLSEKDDGYFSEDEYRGSPVDMGLKIKLYEKHYDKRELGEYYDYINKKNEKRYEYYEVQSLVKEYDINTVNGVCSLDIPVSKELNYFIEVEGVDSKNNRIVETHYIYNWAYYSPYGERGYSIAAAGSKADNLYKTGEKVSLEVRYKGGELPADKTCRFLYLKLKNGILDYTASPEKSYAFDFDKSLIPNMYVKAVCFDGTNIYNAGLSMLRYDQEEKRLDISVTSDKSSYKPGDTVKLSITARDSKGKPKSSEVNLSVVDEAYFAVENQYADTLGGLYWPMVSSGLITDYFSYTPVDEFGSPTAEGGEGGDEYVRKDFKDNALFKSVNTGSNGKAEVSFKLPDNLTSWRVTYQGVTNDLFAGEGKINVSSKLPFFTDTVFNKVFMTGDSPSLLVRSFGASVSDTDTVKYKVTLEGEVPTPSGIYEKSGLKQEDTDPVHRVYALSENAGKPAYIDFGKLSAGNYTYKLEASCNGMRDSLLKSFKVTDNLLETMRIKYYDLTEQLRLEGGSTTTTVSFFNKASYELYRELFDLNWTWGERIDQKLSRKVAGSLLERYYNEESTWDEEFDIRKYQCEDGGLAMLSYDSSSPEISAEVAAFAADYIDRPALESYFYNILNNPESAPEDMAYSCWGLAALGKPVLLETKSLLGAESPNLVEKLALGNALAELGDYEGANKVYSSIMEQYGKSEDRFAYIDTGSGRDDSIKATALEALIALRINSTDKMKLFQYTSNNSTTELLVNLERLIFVSRYLPVIPREVSFSYQLDGVKKDIVLPGGSPYTIDLAAGRLPGISFGNIKGDITAAVSYKGNLRDLMSDSSSLISLNRSYSIKGSAKLWTDPSGKGGPVKAAGIKRSDTVLVSLTPSFGENAPDGWYEVTDVLPAGFRYVAGRYESNDKNDWYPDEVSGQKVSFGYYYKKGNPVKSITYHAKSVSPGMFTADNAVIRYSRSETAGFTGRIIVDISK